MVEQGNAGFQRHRHAGAIDFSQDIVGQVGDEPEEHGGSDEGPNPQEMLAVSLASCTAITMEMYAARKGWDIGHVEVDVEYSPAERGCPTKFELVMRLPEEVPEEQMERLRAIAAKCPVHRALDGEVMFLERIERVHMAA